MPARAASTAARWPARPTDLQWWQFDDPGAWQAFLRAWQGLHARPVTAHTLCVSAADDPALWRGTFPRTSLGDLPSAKSLGRILTERFHRPPAGALVVRSVIDSHRKVRLYWVDRADQPHPINRLAGAASFWW